MAGTRFSVIITSFNQRPLLRTQWSHCSPFGVRFEIIVVDDGSTDGSHEMLEAYRAITLAPIPTNCGKGPARNHGASLATGDYLVFLDGDDVLLPWALDVYGRVAEATTPALILAPMLWFRDHLGTLRQPDPPHTVRLVEYPDYLHKDRPFGVSASSVVIRRDVFEQVAGWSNMPVMQDQELIIRLATAKDVAHILSPQTVGHRAHANQTVKYVLPYVDAMYELLRKERAGQFPGGRERRAERAAVIGALAFFWTRRAFKAGLYYSSVKLVVLTWVLQLRATSRRLRAISFGRGQPTELAL